MKNVHILLTLALTLALSCDGASGDRFACVM